MLRVAGTPASLKTHGATSMLHSRGTVDSRNLAEYLSSSQVTERNGLALQRIDADAGLAIRNEEYVIGFIEVIENQLTRLITPPVAVRLNALGRLWRQALEQRYFFK